MHVHGMSWIWTALDVFSSPYDPCHPHPHDGFLVWRSGRKIEQLRRRTVYDDARRLFDGSIWHWQLGNADDAGERSDIDTDDRRRAELLRLFCKTKIHS